MGAPFPKIAPSHGDLDPDLTHDFVGPLDPTVETTSRSVQLFVHRGPERVPMGLLYNGTPLSPSKLPFPMGNLDPI